MNTKKISRKTIVRYIRDFSIVVAGIAVTLYINDIVTRKSEKRDMKLYLNAVKMELESNIKTLDNAIEDLQPAIRYSQYLQSQHKDSLNKDTLINYVNICFSLDAYAFKTNAFEMFKTSGAMRLVENKDLLQSLWAIYSGFTSLKELMEWNYKTKWEDLQKDLPLIDLGGNNELKGALLYNYYYLNTPKMMQQNYDKILEETKKVVSLLEETLND